MKAARLMAAVFAVVFAQTLWAQDGADAAKQVDDLVAKAEEEALRGKLQKDDWLVTMQFRDARVEQLVEEFRRQVRISIILDATNIPEEFRLDEFVVYNVPFRAAFNAFMEKAQLVVEDETADLIRISRPPRVTFNFKEADIKSVLDMIARIANANIVISPDVKGTISLNVHDVPWMDVLDAVVKTLNFTTVRERFGIIRIIDPEELKKQMSTKVFPLKYIQPPSLFKANIEDGKFIFGRHPRAPQRPLELLEGFFLLPALKAVLTWDKHGKRQIGQLDYDPQTNAFIVRDVKPVLDQVASIIKTLDKEPAQILVDVKFISTTNEDLLQFGMNYALGAEEGLSMSSKAVPPLSLPSISTTNDIIKESPGTEPFSGKISRLPFGLGHEPISSSQYFLTSYDMLATFRAFKRDRYSRLIQEPTITAVDNELATIFIGEEIRYAEQTVSTTEFGTIESTVGEARRSPVKVGFQLFILPKVIRESNKVLLTVIPVNDVLTGTTSPLAGFDRFTLTGIGAGGADVSIDLPRVSSTTLVTKMLLESGKTAVIGGLVVERSTLEDKKIPILGDLPLVSYLFKQSTDTVRREHLLIFVTPRIVWLDMDNERVQARFRRHEEELRRGFEEMRRREAEKAVGEDLESRTKKEKGEFQEMKADN